MALAADKSGLGEEGASALALTSFEVAIAGGDGGIRRAPAVIAVHGGDSWSSRLRGSPRRRRGKSCRRHLLGFRLLLHLLRAGDYQHAHRGAYLATFMMDAAARGSEMRGVGAATNTTLMAWPLSGTPGLRSMYFRALMRSISRSDRTCWRIGDRAETGLAHARVGAECDHRFERVGIQHQFFRVRGAFVRRQCLQRASAASQSFPVGANSRPATYW